MRRELDYVRMEKGGLVRRLRLRPPLMPIATLRPGSDDPRLIRPETTPHLQLQPPRDSRLLSFACTLAAVLLFVGFGTCVWLGRETLFRGLTDLWIISDPITHGDAAVVLGGGLEYRPFVAAGLYKKVLASRVLISRVCGGRVGPSLGHTEFNRKALLSLGVPDAVIESVWNGK